MHEPQMNYQFISFTGTMSSKLLRQQDRSTQTDTNLIRTSSLIVPLVNDHHSSKEALRFAPFSGFSVDWYTLCKLNPAFGPPEAGT